MTAATANVPRPRLVLGFDAEDRRSLAKMAGGAVVIIPLAAWLFGGIARPRRKA